MIIFIDNLLCRSVLLCVGSRTAPELNKKMVGFLP